MTRMMAMNAKMKRIMRLEMEMMTILVCFPTEGNSILNLRLRAVYYWTASRLWMCFLTQDCSLISEAQNGEWLWTIMLASYSNPEWRSKGKRHHVVPPWWYCEHFVTKQCTEEAFCHWTMYRILWSMTAVRTSALLSTRRMVLTVYLHPLNRGYLFLMLGAM